MIISNNNFNSNNNNFKNNINSIKNSSINIDGTHINQKAHKDVNNRNEMIDQSIAMLQQRLNRGLISLEEFHKQCEKLGKLRK